MRKLKAIVVDDSPLICKGMKDLCRHSARLEVTETFNRSSEFLEAEPNLDYDLCLLDICMPEMDGFMVASKISKPIIFITLAEEKLKEALAHSPIDILIKPFTADRLESAFEKAQKLISKEENVNDYALFNVLEEHAKMRIRLSDILYVKSDTGNPRNKHLWMRNSKHCTITSCNFEKLLQLAPKLVQVNRRELISLEAVESFKYDLINITDKIDNGAPKQITLSNTFRQTFMRQVHMK